MDNISEKNNIVFKERYLLASLKDKRIVFLNINQK